MLKVIRVGFSASLLLAALSAVTAEPSHLLGHASGSDNGGGFRYGGTQSREYQQVSAAHSFIGGRRYDAALALLQPLSAGNFAPAQTLLGSMYAVGRGVEQDAVKAAQLYETAALGGDPYAMYLFGYALDTGTGVPQNRELAMMWMQRASDSGKIELQKAVRNYREHMTG